MSRAGTWFKMLATGVVLCVGGPAFVQWIRPTDEELFKRYNPDLQKRSVEEGESRAQDFDNYVNNLKRWSKSDKSIWVAAQEEQDARRAQAAASSGRSLGGSTDDRTQREEMRKELMGEK